MSQTGQNFVEAYSRSQISNTKTDASMNDLEPTALATQAAFPPAKPPRSGAATAAFESPIERRIDPGQEIGQSPHVASNSHLATPQSSQQGLRWKRFDSQTPLVLNDQERVSPIDANDDQQVKATQQQLVESLEHVVFVDRVTLPSDGWSEPGSVLDTTSSENVGLATPSSHELENLQTAPKANIENLNGSNQGETETHNNSRQPMRVCWELDVFDVPRTVAKLFFDQERFEAIGGRLIEAAQSGLKTMMITSRSPGEGRTSVAIGMALAAASGPLRVAVLDADGATDSIATQMQLEVSHGWLDHIRDGVHIEETGVYSHEDNLVLFPMVRRDDGPMHPAECGSFVWRLRDHFDLILVDAPAATRLHAGPMADAIDSAVIVQDSRIATDDNSISALATNLRLAGIEGIGLVKNYLD
ncbi:MAG: hypothetical protein AAF664_08330 [Planctomycetota bacterium]